jgi:zinc transport system permease protein
MGATMPDNGASLQAFVDALDLFVDPLLAATWAGALLGLLGVYVLVRRMVFLSAALSQSAGLGVAGAWYAQIHLGLAASWCTPTLGAAVATLGAAALMLAGPRSMAARRDSALGLVYLLGSAGTLALGTRIVQEVQDIETILFGSAVAVLPEDAAQVRNLALGLGVIHLWWHRGLTQVAVDPLGARIRRLPVRLLEWLLVLSLAAAVSVCTRVLGALPVFAFTVLPAMAALQVAPNVPWALLIAAVAGAVAGAGGYLAAYLWELPVGASQSLVAALLLAAAWLVGRVLDWQHRRAAHPSGEVHVHSQGCGHLAVPHGDHTDYVVAGQVQHGLHAHDHDHHHS